MLKSGLFVVACKRRQMKKLLATVVLVLFTALSAVPSEMLTAFKDYTMSNRILSVGVASWSDEDHTLVPAAYFNLAFLNFFSDHLRIGAGMLGGYDDEVLFRFQTSVTSRILDSVEVGVWYAPFWGYKSQDDPYGVMLGYVFKFE
jgi:hypothetical protein